MTNDEHIAAHPNDADALAAYEADPVHWSAVPSHRVIAWLGEAGRLFKLKEFARAGTSDPQTIALQSAVETVLLATANPNTEIEVRPGTPHRQLLSLIPKSILSDSDAEALIARGRSDSFVQYTVEQIAARRAELAKAAARAALVSRVTSIAAAWVNNLPTEGELPTFADFQAHVATAT